MDLLYVVTTFPSLSQSFVINEIYELERRGHNVSVFSFENSNDTITHSEFDDIDIEVHYANDPSFSSFPDLFTKKVINFSVLSQALFVDGPLHHAYYLHLARQIIETVDSIGGIDLIHAHFATWDRLPVTYATAYHDIPCTVTAHAHEIFSPFSMPRLKRVLARFDHVIVPSEYNKRYLSEEICINTEMTVVPATTSVDKFKPSDSCVPGRLLTIARLVEKKGYEYTVDAVAELIDQGYNVEYHIVGTGERKNLLRERVRELGIEDYVEFLGHVSDEKLQSELHESELFVLPCVIASDGDRDVAPVALKEAMATQTACVSTSISAIPELITDGYNGILVEPNNSTALVEAISSLLDNSGRRKEIAANGRETVENQFDISQTVDELVSAFQSCIRSHGGHRTKAIDSD